MIARPLCFLFVCVLWVAIAPSFAGELLPPEREIPDVIDAYVGQKLAAANVSAASPVDDANLVRRTTLDFVGRIPTVVEAKAFVQSTEPNKRTQLVDRLLASPEFVRQQVDYLDTLLMHGTKANLRDYLLQAVRENRPWDRMFREMLLGRDDDPEQKGPLQFVRARVGDVDKLTNEVSVLFFGVNISCAKCHDHPLAPDWTQDHFFGMKSFFERSFENGGFVGEREYGFVNYKSSKGESRDAKLMFLTGETLAEPESKPPTDEEKKQEKQRLEELKKNKQPPPPPSYSRRAQVVELGLKPTEPSFFTRSIVNHLWNRLLGRGLVMPVDQMHSANPPSHPELLDWLARDLASHGYDLRRLIRGIALSQVYARSSVWAGGERPAAELFAVANVRPLSPFQYATSMRLAATSPDYLAADGNGAEADKRLDSIANSARGLIDLFEVPGDDFQVGVDESLLFSNNERIERELLRKDKDGLVGKLIATEDRAAAIEIACWTIYSRPPSPEEADQLAAFLAARADRLPEAYRQLVWAMLTSSECRFDY